MCVRRCSEDSVGVNLIEFLYIRTLVCEGAKLLSARHSGLLAISYEKKWHIFLSIRNLLFLAKATSEAVFTSGDILSAKFSSRL